MDFISENRQVPVSDECGVLVAGGGIAGISAALAAARAGANVILVEREYMLGGLGTAGLVTIYLPLCDGNGRQVSFGISEELLRLSIKHGAEGRYPAAWLENGTDEDKRTGQRFMVSYNPHIFAILVEHLLRDEGVKILYGTVVCDVKKEGGKISAILIENKTGRSAIRLKSVVDTTGDADICKFAYAKTSLYKKENILASWYYYLTEGELKLNMLGAADTPAGQEETENLLINRRFKAATGEEISEMVQLSHDFVLKDVLERRGEDKTHTPVTIASIPQVRMTRRLVGAYDLGYEEGKDFEDSIGVIGNWRHRGPSYQIPFRCLYGNEVDNLITAGRCISVTDEMWDFTRVIPACAVTGEAAGAAAAMTDSFKTLDINKLQKHLKNMGVKIKQQL